MRGLCHLKLTKYYMYTIHLQLKGKTERWREREWERWSQEMPHFIMHCCKVPMHLFSMFLFCCATKCQNSRRKKEEWTYNNENNDHNAFGEYLSVCFFRIWLMRSWFEETEKNQEQHQQRRHTYTLMHTYAPHINEMN